MRPAFQAWRFVVCSPGDSPLSASPIHAYPLPSPPPPLPPPQCCSGGRMEKWFTTARPGLRHGHPPPATNSETLATKHLIGHRLSPLHLRLVPTAILPTIRSLSDWLYGWMDGFGASKGSSYHSLTYHECFCYPISCLSILSFPWPHHRRHMG